MSGQVGATTSIPAEVQSDPPPFTSSGHRATQWPQYDCNDGGATLESGESHILRAAVRFNR